MEIPVYSTKWDKINLVATYLMSGPDCGWLFLVGPGGDGKSMATYEATKLWRRSLGEDLDDPSSELESDNILYLPCHRTDNSHKIVLMKKGFPIVKTIVHLWELTPEWIFMAAEWNAKVVRFERGNEPQSDI